MGQEDDVHMSNHPYKKFEESPAWECLEAGIASLADNQDIQELTDRRYIVGYLVKQLAEAGLIRERDS